MRNLRSWRSACNVSFSSATSKSWARMTEDGGHQSLRLARALESDAACCSGEQRNVNRTPLLLRRDRGKAHRRTSHSDWPRLNCRNRRSLGSVPQ